MIQVLQILDSGLVMIIEIIEIVFHIHVSETYREDMIDDEIIYEILGITSIIMNGIT